MPITLRPLTGDDAERTAALINEGASEPTSVEKVRGRLRTSRRTPGDGLRLGAFDGGEQLGYGHAVRDEWMPAGLYWLHIAVDPALRRRGIGSQLYSALRDHVTSYGATTLRGEAREAEPASLAFAQHMGFAIDRHIFESTLDLARFDERPFAGTIERVGSQGIRLLTMADAGDTPDARRRLYELMRTVALDIPGGSESSTRPYEAFLTEVCDSPQYVPAGQILAADGDDWIGMVGILNIPASDGYYNGLTGVLPAYRGRGIALALKLLAIAAARRHGAAYLRTNNDSENASMLAINRKLGYRPEPGYYRLLASLAPQR
jgi:GNAT superfamily N-acetyltransferase